MDRIGARHVGVLEPVAVGCKQALRFEGQRAQVKSEERDAFRRQRRTEWMHGANGRVQNFELLKLFCDLRDAGVFRVRC